MFFFNRSVLIVPYGIETWNKDDLIGRIEVLIVPYGIETSILVCSPVLESVLIVPYGIETRYVIYIQAAIMVC